MGLPQAKASVREEFPPEASLLAEIERLKRELAVARARIGELEARADIDPLLDVLNRRGFERELKRALAHTKRYGTQAALMFVDLDNFKSVNDRHGHGTGDALLKAVTREITRHVRASDVVGRLGGDEFGVLLWRVDEAQAVTKARELEGLLARVSVMHGQVHVQVGASVGAALLRADVTPAEIITAADRAMYGRKDEKRGLPAVDFQPAVRTDAKYLRDDVGRELIFDAADLVAQDELSLLQSLYLNKVGTGRGHQGRILPRRGRGVPAAGAPAAPATRVLPRRSLPPLVFFAPRRRLGKSAANYCVFHKSVQASENRRQSKGLRRFAAERGRVYRRSCDESALDLNCREPLIEETYCMSMQSHLAELEKRHQALEEEITECLTHPAVDDLKNRGTQKTQITGERRNRTAAP